MKCPFCLTTETKVIDSREVSNTFETKRRRECEMCHKRFNTYERIEQNPIVIRKKDGRREPFSVDKLYKSISNACYKRAVAPETIENICAEILAKLRNENDSEIPSSVVGEYVMDALKETDKVSYIRFASIYREFADLNDYKKVIKEVTSK